ncbi:MAG: hypothetical protein INR71_00440 [Terriglobus roseus]|nr:hypothetical protein [Terriglobus roseus]
MMSPVRTPSPSPSRLADHRPKGLFDSPFSDYHTDTSPVFSPTARFTSPFQQKLLTRLNRIGTQVLRRSLSDDASKDIEVGLDALENRIQAPEVKSRESADVADSGLFVDDDEDEADAEDDDVYDSQEDSSDDDMVKSRDGLGLRMSSSPESELLESPFDSASVRSALANKVVMDNEEALALVARVTKVAKELRERHEEVRHLNDQMVGRLENASNEVLHLRSENEALRADLSFDHSELLFLKLQLKAVQLSIEPHIPADGQYTSSVSKSLSEGLERWKKDWKDVDLKFQARRARYAMADPPASTNDDTATSIRTTRSGSQQRPAATELRLPTRIVAIRRPNAPRSFTSPPVKTVSPAPAEPLTPDLTSGSEDEHDVFTEHKEAEAKPEEVELPQAFAPLDALADEPASSGAEREDGEEDDHVPADDEVDDDNDDEYEDDEALHEVDREEGDASEDNEDEPDVEQVPIRRSRATITTHALLDESDEEDDEDDYDEGDISYDESDDDKSTQVSKPARTPWQELWDGLTEYAGLIPDDD